MFHMTLSSFYIPQNINLTKAAYFSTIFYYIEFQDPALSVLVFLQPQKIVRSAIFLLLMTEH